MGYVELTRLTKTFTHGRFLLKAVDDVSFEIPQGKTFGLVGESGSGKSTIAKMIVGLFPPDDGLISIAGKTYGRLKAREKNEYLQNLSIVFQNPFSSLDPKINVFGIVSEPLRAFNIYSQKELRKRVGELLEKVGLSAEQHMHRYPHEFSGGQRQRIAIARAISFHPRLLILDEPTSALDVSVQAKTINLLTRLQKEFGLTYLFISHNMGVIRHISDIIGVMYRGRLLEIGDADAVINASAHPYTQYLVAAIPKLSRIEGEKRTQEYVSEEAASAGGDGCPFVSRCPKRLPSCEAVFPARTILKEGRTVYCHLYG
jgi:oligopeptide/dipeptide ABC transporter ATP-binding protein